MHGTRGSTPHSARDTWKRSTQCTKHFELPGVTGTPAPQFSKKSAEKKARQGEKTEDGEQSAPRASRRQPYLRDKDCVRRDESESRWCQNSAHARTVQRYLFQTPFGAEALSHLECPQRSARVPGPASTLRLRRKLRVSRTALAEMRLLTQVWSPGRDWRIRCILR